MVIAARMSLSDDCWNNGMSRTADKKKKKFLDEMKDQESEDDAFRTPPLPAHCRHTSSKYDFVKVRVWLGDNADHYYVLSRFLVSRMLTVTKIPNHVAIKISLELKKLLVDNSLFDVSQSDLETNLFKLMERRGYGEDYINRYRMITRFHHQRVPLVILVCGTACVGKSTVATHLAQRLNLPNVLQTDMVYELIRTSTDAPLSLEPIWEREFESQEELVTEFARECRIIRKGLKGDLKKAMKDGKPIIIEGIHLDPSIYLLDEECNGKVNHRTSSSSLGNDKNAMSKNCEQHSTFLATQVEASRLVGLDASNLSTDIFTGYVSNNASSKAIDTTCKEQPETYSPNLLADKDREGIYADNMVVKDNSKSDSQAALAETSGEPVTSKRPANPTSAIIVPIVLSMDEFDHKTLLEEWIACRSAVSTLDETKKEALINRLMTIQDYLCSFKSQGIIVRHVSATTFPQTLDALHSYLLQRMEECQSRDANNKIGKDPI